MTTEKKQWAVAYIYIAPFYILFFIFGLFPLAGGLYLSFFRWDGVAPMRIEGLRNYINLLKDPLFGKALKNTLFIGIVSHISILLIGLTLAYILNSRLVRFKDAFKTVFFLPMVTSIVAVTIIFQNFFGYNFGFFNVPLRLLGFEPLNWLGGDGSLIKAAVLVLFSWKWIGWNVVMYLAGMQGISTDIYEAATIDGAGHFRIFTRITIPLLKPIILFTLIQHSIGTLSIFTEPFILTNSNWAGGPNNGGLTLMIYLLNKAPQGGVLFGYASACAYVITVLIILYSFVITKLMADKDQAGNEAV
jgi:ABC-type sugar transport system permease subunit